MDEKKNLVNILNLCRCSFGVNQKTNNKKHKNGENGEQKIYKTIILILIRIRITTTNI